MLTLIKAGCTYVRTYMYIGCNVEIGYSVQGLVAKVKDIVANTYVVNLASVWGTPVEGKYPLTYYASCVKVCIQCVAHTYTTVGSS